MGYDVFSIPQVHYSEQRRLLEAKQIENEQRRARRSSTAGDPARGEREQIKTQATQNAIQEYKQERGLT